MTALLVSACGDSKSSVDADTMAGRGGSAGSSGSGSAGAGKGGMAGAGALGGGGTAGAAVVCNTLDANAPEYTAFFVADAKPEALGGTIVDGTYFVTRETWFDSPSVGEAVFSGIRFEIDGSVWQEADSADEAAELPAGFYTYRAMTEGVTLTLTPTCPTEDPPDTFEYTVEGSDCTVYVTAGGVDFALTLTRQ